MIDCAKKGKKKKSYKTNLCQNDITDPFGVS